MGRIFYFSIVISPTFGKLNKRSVINRIYEKNYNKYLSKDYIYTKISEFKSDYVKTNIDNQEGITKTIENTDNIYEFTIGYKGEKLKTYKILTIKNKKEDKYKINGKYVYIKGKYEENSIEVTNGIIEEEKEEYEIPLIITQPDKTVNDIGTEAFPDLLGTCSTKYNASNTGRTTNLKLAAGKINGKVLLVGDEFSYNQTVGERTIAAGYKMQQLIQVEKL